MRRRRRWRNSGRWQGQAFQALDNGIRVRAAVCALCVVDFHAIPEHRAHVGRVLPVLLIKWGAQQGGGASEVEGVTVVPLQQRWWWRQRQQTWWLPRRRYRCQLTSTNVLVPLSAFWMKPQTRTHRCFPPCWHPCQSCRHRSCQYQPCQHRSCPCQSYQCPCWHLGSLRGRQWRRRHRW